MVPHGGSRMKRAYSRLETNAEVWDRIVMWEEKTGKKAEETFDQMRARLRAKKPKLMYVIDEFLSSALVEAGCRGRITCELVTVIGLDGAGWEIDVLAEAIGEQRRILWVE